MKSVLISSSNYTFSPSFSVSPLSAPRCWYFLLILKPASIPTLSRSWSFKPNIAVVSPVSFPIATCQILDYRVEKAISLLKFTKFTARSCDWLLSSAHFPLFIKALAVEKRPLWSDRQCSTQTHFLSASSLYWAVKKHRLCCWLRAPAVGAVYCGGDVSDLWVMAGPGSLELALSQRQRLAEGVSSVSGVLEGWRGQGGLLPVSV